MSLAIPDIMIAESIKRQSVEQRAYKAHSLDLYGKRAWWRRLEVECNEGRDVSTDQRIQKSF